MTREEILKKLQDFGKNFPQIAKDFSKQIMPFIKKWTSIQTWKDLFIPENPEEHPRMVRFLGVVLILVCIMIGIISLITFNVIRLSTSIVRVPSVANMDIIDAVAILQSEKLQPHFEMVYDDNHYKYQVISQYPSRGSSVREGRNITLTVSLGKDQYTVPELLTLSKEEAINILEATGIRYTINIISTTSIANTNKVTKVNKTAGEVVSRDTILTVTVTDSVLANQYKMPNFTNQPLEFAANTLFNNRITPIIVTTNVESLSDDGLVLAQNISEGKIVSKNTKATLTVGLYAYNEGDRQKQKWHFFNFHIPRVENQQIIVTNEDGTLEDIGEQKTAKFYKAVVEDELGQTSIIFERTGAEGTSFSRVFKSYGRSRVYVYADDEIIGSREYR